jgi:hypothetical protein
MSRTIFVSDVFQHSELKGGLKGFFEASSETADCARGELSITFISFVQGFLPFMTYGELYDFFVNFLSFSCSFKICFCAFAFPI